MKWAVWGAMVWIGLLTAAGCDKAPAPPQQASKTATSEPVVPRPTTQELMSGPYKRLVLPGMPLALNVPQSWNIDVGKDFPVTFVTGPSPYGQLIIRLSQTDANTFKQEQIDKEVAEAKKKLADSPDQYKKAEHRQSGGMNVLEQLKFEKAHSTPKLDGRGMGMLDDKGELIMVTIQPVEWSLTIFVSGEQDFRRHQLKVFDLTAEQYTKDQALLEKIFRTLSLDASAAPAPAPAGPGPAVPAPAR